MEVEGGGSKRGPLSCWHLLAFLVPAWTRRPGVAIVQGDRREAKFNINKGPAAQLLFLCMSEHIVGGERGSSPVSRSGSGFQGSDTVVPRHWVPRT